MTGNNIQKSVSIVLSVIPVLLLSLACTAPDGRPTDPSSVHRISGGPDYPAHVLLTVGYRAHELDQVRPCDPGQWTPPPETVTDAVASTATTLRRVGNTQVIPLAQAKSPIVDANGDWKVDALDITVSITGTEPLGTVAVSSVVPVFFTSPGIVTVVMTTAGNPTTLELRWKTSRSVASILAARPAPAPDFCQYASYVKATHVGSGNYRVVEIRGSAGTFDDVTSGSFELFEGAKRVVNFPDGTSRDYSWSEVEVIEIDWGTPAIPGQVSVRYAGSVETATMPDAVLAQVDTIPIRIHYPGERYRDIEIPLLRTLLSVRTVAK